MDDARHGRNDDVFAGKESTRVPLRVYEDPEIYRREMQRIFYGPTWNFVGFADEVPNTGDYKIGWIGERTVVITRSKDGEISVLENICAHRGMQLVWEERGNKPLIVMDTTILGPDYRS